LAARLGAEAAALDGAARIAIGMIVKIRKAVVRRLRLRSGWSTEKVSG
jgi:hypothetical protein